MKKKILAVVLAGVMAMSMLTACGGSDDTTETADVETTEDAASDDAASDEACSDETFGTLQDNYAVMVDAYNQVKELYESDEIAGDAEIEDLMNQAADVINEMGEISQDTITESDAETLNGAMLDILDGLSGIVDAMEATGDEESTADEACSDETFATLQDNYAALTDVYNTVYDAYMSDEIEQNDEIESALSQTADVINEMGEISQDTITELDAETLNDTMLTLLDVLDAVVDAM